MPSAIAPGALLPSSSTLVQLSPGPQLSSSRQSFSSASLSFNPLPSSLSVTPENVVPPFLLEHIQDITLPQHVRAEALYIFQIALIDFSNENPDDFAKYVGEFLIYLLTLLVAEMAPKFRVSEDDLDSGCNLVLLRFDNNETTKHSETKPIVEVQSLSQGTLVINDMSACGGVNRRTGSRPGTAASMKKRNSTPDDSIRKSAHQSFNNSIFQSAVLKCLHFVVEAGKSQVAYHLDALFPSLLLHHLHPAYTRLVLSILKILLECVPPPQLLSYALRFDAFAHPSLLVREAFLGPVCDALAASNVLALQPIEHRLTKTLWALVMEATKDGTEVTQAREWARKALRLIYRCLACDGIEGTQEVDGQRQEGRKQAGRRGGDSVFWNLLQAHVTEAMILNLKSWLPADRQEIEHKHKENKEDQGRTGIDALNQELLVTPPGSPSVKSFCGRSTHDSDSRRERLSRSLIPRPPAKQKLLDTRRSPASAFSPPLPLPLVASSAPDFPSTHSPSSCNISPGAFPPPTSPIVARRGSGRKGIVDWRDDHDDEETQSRDSTFPETPSPPTPCRSTTSPAPRLSLKHPATTSSSPPTPTTGLFPSHLREGDENVTDKPGYSAPQSPLPQSEHRLQPRVRRLPSQASSPSSSSHSSPVGPSSAPTHTPTIQYLTIAQLRPLPDPNQSLTHLVTSLPTADWPENFHSLTTIRRLALHHPDILFALSPPSLRLLLVELFRLIDNLRSAVAKNALLTLADVWSHAGRAPKPKHSEKGSVEGIDPRLLENALPILVPPLLRRCCDTSGFLAQTAEAAFEAVIHHTPDMARLLSALLPMAAHKHPLARRRVATVVRQCLSRLAATSSFVSPVTGAGSVGPLTKRMHRKKRAGNAIAAADGSKNKQVGCDTLSAELRERLIKAKEKWLGDADAETRAEGRKIVEILQNSSDVKS